MNFQKCIKTLNFPSWRFCYTLRVGCNKLKNVFQISQYFINFDISTLYIGHISPKIPILGDPGWAEMLKLRKLADFQTDFLDVFASSAALRRRNLTQPVGNERWDQDLSNAYR